MRYNAMQRSAMSRFHTLFYAMLCYAVLVCSYVCAERKASLLHYLMCVLFTVHEHQNIKYKDKVLWPGFPDDLIWSAVRLRSISAWPPMSSGSEIYSKL